MRGRSLFFARQHPAGTANCRHPHFTEPEVVRLPGIALKGLPERDEGIICVFWDLPSKTGGGCPQGYLGWGCI